MIDDLIKILDMKLCVSERLWMTYDGYMREEYESAMQDQFMYHYYVDKYQTALEELNDHDRTCLYNMQEFKLEFLND